MVVRRPSIDQTNFPGNIATFRRKNRWLSVFRVGNGQMMNPPESNPHFLGLRTVIYHVPELEKAKEWYSQILGAGPYFDQPFYVGFHVGGYELGLDPNSAASGAGGAVAYWGVADARAAFERLISLGATAQSEVQDVGEGIRVATVVDPFGNVFGIIENPALCAGERTDGYSQASRPST